MKLNAPLDKPHPAKFTDAILKEMRKYIPENSKVFDPFSGTGKLKKIVHSNLFLNEIEFEWAIQGKPANVTVGDALVLPYANECFDVICTSPTYGNRMADHHKAKDNSRRNTYTHSLKRILHQNNSGKMQWGTGYKEFHKYAWNECFRTLKCGGIFIINVSNHIRDGKEIFVSEWHLEFLVNELNMTFLENLKINTPRNRFGQNGKLRVEHENIFILKKPLTK